MKYITVLLLFISMSAVAQSDQFIQVFPYSERDTTVVSVLCETTETISGLEIRQATQVRELIINHMDYEVKYYYLEDVNGCYLLNKINSR